MRTGRPKKPLDLNDEEREKLQQWARRPKTAQRLALRSRIVLGCAEGLPNQVVARQCGTSSHTVGKWRERFRAARLEGLVDEPRPRRAKSRQPHQPPVLEHVRLREQQSHHPQRPDGIVSTASPRGPRLGPGLHAPAPNRVLEHELC